MSVRQLTIVMWVGSLLLVVAGCSSGRQAGTEAARRDIAKGHLELRIYGMRAHNDRQYAQLLQDQLGVRWHAVADCTVSERVVIESDAYNAVMTKEIERRYGVGILERLEREAKDMTPTTQAI